MRRISGEPLASASRVSSNRARVRVEVQRESFSLAPALGVLRFLSKWGRALTVCLKLCPWANFSLSRLPENQVPQRAAAHTFPQRPWRNTVWPWDSAEQGGKTQDLRARKLSTGVHFCLLVSACPVLVLIYPLIYFNLLRSLCILSMGMF